MKTYFAAQQLQLLQDVLSRKFEYAADGYAADRGYGQVLCSGLKKLEKNGMLAKYQALLSTEKGSNYDA